MSTTLTQTEPQTDSAGVQGATSIFSQAFKKTRLLIAKWAIKPDNITAEDLQQYAGIDVTGIITKAVAQSLHDQQPKVIRELLPKSLANASIDELSAIIASNTNLREAQKTALASILKHGTTASYLQ